MDRPELVIPLRRLIQNFEAQSAEDGIFDEILNAGPDCSQCGGLGLPDMIIRLHDRDYQTIERYHVKPPPDNNTAGSVGSAVKVFFEWYCICGESAPVVGSHVLYYVYNHNRKTNS